METLLGRLGRATMPAAIYASPDIGSSVYYQVARGQYLVLRDTRDTQWQKVLLQNRQYGYIQANSVDRTQYEVRGPGNQETKGPADSALELVGPVKDVRLDSGRFVQRLYAKHGVKLASRPDAQSKVGKSISKLENLRKGDRVYFWGKEADKIDQVGIYLGNGFFIYLDGSQRVVKTQYIDKKWLDHLVVARR